MKTGLKVALGVGLLGGALFWFSSTGAVPVVQTKQEAVDKAQDLLAFFQRVQGIVLNGSNSEQNKRVADFQIAWNKAQPSMGYRLPKVRTDGVWDNDTGAVFKQLTGYTPPQKQILVTAGI